MTSSVSLDERLARYIVYSRWLRANNTVKPEAFMPSGNPLELSVTQHVNLNEDGIWKAGNKVATKKRCTLHGRADIAAAIVIAQKLQVERKPTKGNKNHANVINWPLEKFAIKMCALEIANKASFVSSPK